MGILLMAMKAAKEGAQKMQVRDLQLKKVDVSGAKGPPDSDRG
jgi:hypothetical protein